MDTLFFMNAPATTTEQERRDRLALLQAAVAINPDLTWGEFLSSLEEYSEGLQPGALGNPAAFALIPLMASAGAALTRVVGRFAGGAWRGAKNIVGAVFDKKKVSDSLADAARGVGDDALDRFLTALPFGIGSDLKSGHVFNAIWPFLLIGAGLLFFFLWKRKKGKR